MITIINLSALAEPIQTRNIPTYLLSYADKNIPHNWPSIEAFAKLQSTYAPQTPVSSLFSCRMFNIPMYSYGWIMTHMDNELISQYKLGDFKTKEFLIRLLNIFGFLKESTFSKKIKEDLFNDRKDLISINHISEFEELTQELIAMALLEKAWLARMKFSEQTDRKIQYFFSENNEDTICITANSNAIDCIASVKYLSKIYPSLLWLSAQELYEHLEVQDNKSDSGIPLTKDGRIKLYVSYMHKAFKTGHSDETTVTTASLLQKIVEQEQVNLEETRLISQWEGDLKMAKNLGIKEIIDAKTYFLPTEFNFKNVKS